MSATSVTYSHTGDQTIARASVSAILGRLDRESRAILTAEALAALLVRDPEPRHVERARRLLTIVRRNGG